MISRGERPGARGIRKKNAWARRKGFPTFAALHHALANNLRNTLQALNGTVQHTNPGHARTVRKGSGLSARQYRIYVRLEKTYARLEADLERLAAEWVPELRLLDTPAPVIRPPEVVQVQAA